MKALSHKWAGRSGMTMVETLFAALLAAALALAVLVGAQAAARVSARETFVAESQTVADTLEQALSDVLRYATEIETDNSGRVTAYTNNAYGLYNAVFSVGTEAEDTGMLYLRYEGKGRPGNMLLLSNLSYSGLQIIPVGYIPPNPMDSAFDLRYADGVFSGNYRLYSPGKQLMSEEFRFSFRALNA